MELYRVGLPKDDDIIVRDKFIIDTIIPLCIKKITDNQFSILFFAEQESTETSIFLQSIISVTDQTDTGFLLNHHLNVDNIRKNPDRLKFYTEKISHINGNIFNTDFDMDIYEENKLYFKSVAVKPLNSSTKDDTKAFLMDLIITRDNYIKISLFMTKFLLKDINAESVFISNKLKNIKFETMNHVKLDASSSDKANQIVYNHYTMGAGPSMYRMNFLSPMKKGRLRNPMIADQYVTFYINDFLVTDVLYDYHQDRILILYEVRTKLNNSYKETKVLILNKDIYDHTNFYDLYKVYEDDK